MCAYDPDLGDAGLELKTLEFGTTVRLWNPDRSWDDVLTQICVELVADGVHGVAHGVTLLGAQGDFSTYFDDLADSFAGWEGTRTWETADRHLRVDARHMSRGFVELTWTIAPWSCRPRAWSMSMASRIEAGEGMRQLAAAIYGLVRPNEQ